MLSLIKNEFPSITTMFQEQIVTDIKEVDDKIVIEANLAGFKKDEIHTYVENNYLIIEAEKKLNEKDKYYSKESYSKVSRSWYIGNSINSEEVSAEYENGILKITIPKKKDEEQLSKSTIEIK